MRRPALVKMVGDLMREKFPLVQTYVYGSEARGDARPDSDVDLLVLFPENTDMDIFKSERYKILDAIFDLEIDLAANFSPLILTRDMWNSRVTPFTINVNREAILI